MKQMISRLLMSVGLARHKQRHRLMRTPTAWAINMLSRIIMRLASLQAWLIMRKGK